MMKAVMITFDQAHYQRIVTVLDRLNCRGFTHWEQVQGRGSQTGDPHYGSHAWPAMSAAIYTVVEEEKVKPLLAVLRRIDEDREQLGLRAFVWTIEDMI